MKRIEKHLDIYLLLILYFASFIFILTNKGIYWDDWTLYGVSPEGILETFRQAANPFEWVGRSHNFILPLPYSVLVYRASVFASYLFSGLFLFKILSKVGELSPQNRFLITAIFLVAPINSARISIINAAYAWTVFCYFFSWYILSFSNKRNHWILLLLTLPLLIIAYHTASFLPFVFFTIVPFLLYQTLKLKEKKTPLIFLKRYWFFLIMPFVFYIGKGLIWKPSGNYSSYLSIKPRFLIVSIEQLPTIVSDAIRIPYSGHALLYLIVFFLGSGALFYLIKKSVNKNHLKNVLCMTYGLFLVWISVFSYILVGNEVSSLDWNSRNQLLMPLGLAITLTFLLEIIQTYLPSRVALKGVVASLLLAYFTYQNARTYLNFERDYLFQHSLMSNLERNNIIKENSTFVFHDRFRPWTNDRTLRFYEFSGMFRKLFKTQEKFGSTPKNFYISDKKNYHVEEFNLRDYVKDREIIQLDILPGPRATEVMSKWSVMKLLFLRLFSRNYAGIDDLLIIKETSK